MEGLRALFVLYKHRRKSAGEDFFLDTELVNTFRRVKATTFGVIGVFFSYKTKAICI